MSDVVGPNVSHRVGQRAARNTAIQATGEIVGSLASAALFFAMTRRLGQSEVGVYVTATAFVVITMVIVDLGLDRFVTREVARRREAARELFWNVLTLKVALAVPIFALAFGVIHALPYARETRQTAYVLAAAVLFHSLMIMVRSFFVAYEQGKPIAALIVFQRILAAALGFLVLGLGGGVRTIAISYAVSTFAGFLLALLLAYRLMERFPLRIEPRRQRRLLRIGLPYVSQDIFTVLLFRLDAMLLAGLATQAAVGRYGAAYMLMDAFAFVTVSLTGSFAAMYAYLDEHTEPTVSRVYESSLRFSLALLVPVAVTLTTLALPVCKLLFGPDFESAGDPLRLLAPVIVLLSVSALSSSLVISRRSPRVMVAITAVTVAVNVALNVILIPGHKDDGAALAMLITAVVYASLALTAAARTVGRPRALVTVAAPLLSGLVMALVMVGLEHRLALAVLAGTLVYVVSLAGLERVINPSDFAFVRDLVRGRLRVPSEEAGAP